MSGPTTSLVAVSKCDVDRAAVNMLAAVERIRAEERESTIQRILATERRWTRWLKRRRLTRAEAEAEADAPRDDWFNHRWDWKLWRCAASDVKHLAKRLQTAASLSQDGKVWLNLSEAQEVGEYLTRTNTAKEETPTS